MATDRLPGAEVTIVNDTGIIAPPLFERYPVYIGVGDPYKQITDYEMTKGADSGADTIPTVSTVHSIVSAGDLPGISGYTAGVDYTLVGNTVNWLGASEPTSGDAYFITYTENRAASAYDPTLYFDENVVYANHGNKTRTDGNANDVSIAAYLGINAGAKGVFVAQLDPSAWVDKESPTNSELETAFIAMESKLKQIVGYKLLLVPMSSGTLNTTTAADIFFNHAVLASQPKNKQERSVIASLGLTSTYTDFTTFAVAYANERMIVPAAKLPISVSGETSTFDMRMASAALAGKLCSVGIGIEISDEILPNITFAENFTPPEQRFMRGRGVSVMKQASGVVRNIMAITTDTTNALTESLGVQDIKDYTKKYWREGLFAVYKNIPINADTIDDIYDSSEGVLNYLIGETIIAYWDTLAVSQDATEPRKVNVSARVQPAYGLQYLDIEFTFVLSP